MLTQQQCEGFWRDGFLGEAAFIEPSLLAELQEELVRLLEETQRMTGSTSRYDLAADHGPGAIRCRRIKEPYLFSAAFAKLLMSPQVNDVARSLLGDDVYLADMPLNLKPPLAGRVESDRSNEIGWHQDWAFEPLTNDSAITLSVFLCDCDASNGTLQVVPGTHRTIPLYRHGSAHWFTGAVNPADPSVPWERRRLFPARAGSIFVHHTRTLHGSGFNVTDRHRPVQAIGLRAADAWPMDRRMDAAKLRERLICGEVREARYDPAAPQPDPTPRARNTGSLFELQQASGFDLFRSDEIASTAG